MSPVRWTRSCWMLGSLLAVGAAMGADPSGYTRWNVDGDGDWDSAGNWTNGVPNVDKVAAFGSVGSDTATDRTITLSGNSAMWEMIADGSADYTISGPTRTLTIGKAIGNYVAGTAGYVTITGGHHVIDVSQLTWSAAMNMPIPWVVTNGASLRITSPLTIPGNVVCLFDGGGTIRIDGYVSAFDGFGGGTIRNNTTLEAYDGLRNGTRRTFTVNAGSTLRGNGDFKGTLAHATTPCDFMLNGILDPAGDGGVGAGTMNFNTTSSLAGAKVRVYFNNTQEIRFALGSASDKITTANAAAAGTLEIYGRTSGTTTLRLDPGEGTLQGTPYDLVDLSGANSVSSFDISDFTLVNNLPYGATLQWDATGKILQCVVAVPQGTTITVR